MIRRHRTPDRLALVAAQQHVLERLPEHLVEDGVEDRVDHRRCIAKPRDKVEHSLADVGLAVGADGRQQIQHEERRPQYDKREEHHAEDFGRLLLQPDDATVARRVARDDTRVAGMMRSDGCSPLENARRRRDLLTGNALVIHHVIVVAQWD